MNSWAWAARAAASDLLVGRPRAGRRRCWPAPMSEKRKLSSNTTPTWRRSELERHVADVVAVDQHGPSVGS